MAVYKRGYETYNGRLTPEWSRFLVIARDAYRRVFDSKWMITFFLACLLPPLVFAIIIYLPHNAGALSILDLRRLIPIDARFFSRFAGWQCFFAFVLTAMLGPSLISRDLTNNALPLYLCRPFSRAEYVIGKMAVLMILLSGITWVPGLSLFLFQSYLEGWKWCWDNLYIGWALLFGSWIWILLLSLMAMAISAWVKWKLVAGTLIVATLAVAGGIAEAIEKTMHSEAAGVLNPLKDMGVIWASLLRLNNDSGVPFENAVGALVILCVICLNLLSRKIRAYEVEKS